MIKDIVKSKNDKVKNKKWKCGKSSEKIRSINLHRNRICFVNQIIEYVVRNGVIKDMSVLLESPFTDKSTVADLFGDNINLWSGIREVINTINRNANYA